MSHEPISRRPDLKRLVEDGYEIEIRAGHLILHRVPYVTSERTVKYGQLVCPLTDDGSKTEPPADHTMYFAASTPATTAVRQSRLCGTAANAKSSLKVYGSTTTSLAKPVTGKYEDYHHKMTHYAQVIGRCARRIDPGALASAGKLVLSTDRHDPFVFMETASSRAGDYPAEREAVQRQDRDSRARRHGVVHSGLRQQDTRRGDSSVRRRPVRAAQRVPGARSDNNRGARGEAD